MLKEIKTQFCHYFVDDKNDLHREFTSWHNNGHLKEQAYYIDGKLHGEHKEWHRNGTLYEHTQYVNDGLHGEYKSWWPNGQLETHCFHKDDFYHGEYKRYLSTGEVACHCFFVDGVEVSFKEMPYPKTEEDRMYFKLKHDLPLLPVEPTC